VVGVRPATVRIPESAVDPDRAPRRAVFLGDYSHRPNPEAAAFLAREVWPLVRERAPDAELWLAGARAAPDVEALGRLPGVVFRGFVPDLGALLGSVRLVLSPVLSGAGSRIKVLTALAHGLPVVANRLGLRGLPDGVPGIRRAESAGDLASAITSVFDTAGELGRAARAWAEQSLDPRSVAGWQVDAVRDLRGR
jgi:glycosyltransferase involved in cell wall biosynthesis